jgi:hypothetical protein
MEEKMKQKRLNISWLVLMLVAVCIRMPALDNPDSPDLDKKELARLQAAKGLVFRKEWGDAVAALERFKASAEEVVLTSEAGYWLAYSLNKLADDQDERSREIELKQKAFTQLTELGERHPDSRWVKDGRILSVEIADDLVELGLTSYKKFISSASRDDQDIELKLVALDALLQMEDEKAFPILERIIRSHAEHRMRNKALFVLSQSGHPRRVALLLQAARQDSHPSVREKAVFWLGQIPGPEALAGLKEIYASADGEGLREKIVFAISQQGDAAAVKTLIALYRSEKKLEIKKKIIFWLGQMDGEEARQFIESLLE